MITLRDIVDGNSIHDLKAETPSTVSPITESIFNLSMKSKKQGNSFTYVPRKHIEVDNEGPREFRKWERAGKII